MPQCTCSFLVYFFLTDPNLLSYEALPIIQQGKWFGEVMNLVDFLERLMFWDFSPLVNEIGFLIALFTLWESLWCLSTAGFFIWKAWMEISITYRYLHPFLAKFLATGSFWLVCRALLHFHQLLQPDRTCRALVFWRWPNHAVLERIIAWSMSLSGFARTRLATSQSWKLSGNYDNPLNNPSYSTTATPAL